MVFVGAVETIFLGMDQNSCCDFDLLRSKVMVYELIIQFSMQSF